MANTPKGQATRRRILATAWELSDAQGAEVILGGVTLREIAAAADVTPSAVSYHFPTMATLAVGMVEHLADSVSLLPLDAVDALLDRAAEDGLGAVIRMAAQLNWDMLSEPGEVDFERRLTRCYAATGDNADSETIKATIGSMTAEWIGYMAGTYRRTAESVGLRPVEPFTFDELARGAAAIVEGLLYQWMCNPDAVRPELAADLLVAMVGAVMVPAPRTVALAERIAGLPGSPVWDGRDPSDDLALAAGAAALFSSGVGGVTLTEASRALDIGTDEAAERFGSVERLAALSFGRHLPTVTQAIERRRSAGAEVSLTDGVYELARCALADRHCALALLHERHHAALSDDGRSDGGARPHDVRHLVPFDGLLAGPISDVSPNGRHGTDDLSSLVVDTVLGQAATRPRTPMSVVTETALRLVPREF